MERDYEYVGRYGTYTWDSDKFFKDLEKYTGKTKFGFKKFTLKLKEDVWFNFNEVYDLQSKRMWEKGFKDMGNDARLEEFADNFDIYFEKISGRQNAFPFLFSYPNGLLRSFGQL